VVRCWEHEDPHAVADQVVEILEGRARGRRG
jgi:hypothetical protein